VPKSNHLASSLLGLGARVISQQKQEHDGIVAK